MYHLKETIFFAPYSVAFYRILLILSRLVPHLFVRNPLLESVQKRSNTLTNTKHKTYHTRKDSKDKVILTRKQDERGANSSRSTNWCMILTRLIGVTRTIYHVQTRYQMDEDTTFGSIVSAQQKMS